MSSTLPASSAWRCLALEVCANSRLKVSISPKTLAVSASVSGVGAITAPFFPASTRSETRRAVRAAGGLRQQPLEGQHFAENAGGLGQRQRRRRHQRAVLRRQHLMHAMANLMGERHPVARLAL